VLRAAERSAENSVKACAHKTEVFSPNQVEFAAAANSCLPFCRRTTHHQHTPEKTACTRQTHAGEKETGKQKYGTEVQERKKAEDKKGKVGGVFLVDGECALLYRRQVGRAGDRRARPARGSSRWQGHHVMHMR